MLYPTPSYHKLSTSLSLGKTTERANKRTSDARDENQLNSRVRGKGIKGNVVSVLLLNTIALLKTAKGC